MFEEYRREQKNCLPGKVGGPAPPDGRRGRTPGLHADDAVHGFKNITMLHAHAQIVHAAFLDELAPQTAEVHAVGDHDFKDEEGMIAAAFAENGLEIFNIDVMARKDAAHGGDFPGMIRAVGRNDEGLTDFVLAPGGFGGRAHQYGHIHIFRFERDSERTAQGFRIEGIRGLNNINGREFAGKDGLRKLHDIAAGFAESATDRGYNAGTVTAQERNGEIFHGVPCIIARGADAARRSAVEVKGTANDMPQRRTFFT